MKNLALSGGIFCQMGYAEGSALRVSLCLNSLNLRCSYKEMNDYVLVLIGVLLHTLKI